MSHSETRVVSWRIVDKAVELAEASSWEAVRLHQIAAVMGIGLDEIRAHFREKDALIDAWFERADDAVLSLADSGELLPLTPRQRLFRLIMAWLDALEAHRRVSRQMILSKLEPGHLHIQIPAVMRISRTVQWMREGALLTDTGVQRALTETAVTALFLAAFISWMDEEAPGSPRTRRLLDGLLAGAEGLMQLCPFAGRGQVRGDGEAGGKEAAPNARPAG